MNITDLLQKEFIIEELKSKSKKEVLYELSETFLRGNITIDLDAMVEVLLEREKLGSTGIGDGIAIPHGKLPGLENLIVSFGRSHTGIDFDSLDGKPVHIFFLLMAPENSAGQHLKALAKISRMLKEEEFRKKLMNTATLDDIYHVIENKDAAYI
ncbi:MAG TPA: PTS sugar transporter subunit IIA [Deltaproteobacteria bacterium]|nr:PTS sugar transporter subunit IIA [Deltaproteobacteria bacterium]